MARPGRFELPTLCLEGRRSIRLSYGRTSFIDSKPFIRRRNPVLDGLTLCDQDRGSIESRIDLSLEFRQKLLKILFDKFA